MLFKPTTTNEEISSGGGLGKSDSSPFDLSSFLFRFLLLLPFAGVMLAARYWPIGDKRL
jgi:hypothetical protein